MSEQTKTDDGGPAFPIVEHHEVMGSRIDRGMSLRDHFAGQAMAELIGCNKKLHLVFCTETNGPEFNAWGGSPFSDAAEVAAHMAYRLADAMLAARKAVP